MRDDQPSFHDESDFDTDSWATIARLRSIAEAGYFAHELESQAGIAATVHANEDYNALTGTWHTEFQLMVPTTRVEEAIPVLEAMLAANSDRDMRPTPLRDEFGVETSPPSRGLQPWLTSITIGSLAVAVAATVDLVPGPRRAPFQRERLWNQLNQSPEPWIQNNDRRGAIRVLRFDPDSGTALIDEDTNGDGVIDSTIAIEAE